MTAQSNLASHSDTSAPVVTVLNLADVEILRETIFKFNRLDNLISTLANDPKSFEPDKNGHVQLMYFEGGIVYNFLTPNSLESNGPAKSGAYYVPLHSLGIKNISNAGEGTLCERLHTHKGPRIINFTTDNNSSVVMKTLTKPVFDKQDLEVIEIYDEAGQRSVYHTIVPPNTHLTYRMSADVAHAFLHVGTGKAYFESLHTDELAEIEAAKLATASMQNQSEPLGLDCSLPHAVKEEALRTIVRDQPQTFLLLRNENLGAIINSTTLQKYLIQNCNIYVPNEIISAALEKLKSEGKATEINGEICLSREMYIRDFLKELPNQLLEENINKSIPYETGSIIIDTLDAHEKSLGQTPHGRMQL